MATTYADRPARRRSKKRSLKKPTVENERERFVEKTRQEIEIFRRGIGKWKESLETYKTSDVQDGGKKRSMYYEGRCLPLRLVRCKVTRLRRHRRTIRPLKYYTLATQDSESELETRREFQDKDKEKARELKAKSEDIEAKPEEVEPGLFKKLRPAELRHSKRMKMLQEKWELKRWKKLKKKEEKNRVLAEAKANKEEIKEGSKEGVRRRMGTIREEKGMKGIKRPPKQDLLEKGELERMRAMLPGICPCVMGDLLAWKQDVAARPVCRPCSRTSSDDNIFQDRKAKTVDSSQLYRDRVREDKGDTGVDRKAKTVDSSELYRERARKDKEEKEKSEKALVEFPLIKRRKSAESTGSLKIIFKSQSAVDLKEARTKVPEEVLEDITAVERHRERKTKDQIYVPISGPETSEERLAERARKAGKAYATKPHQRPAGKELDKPPETQRELVTKKRGATGHRAAREEAWHRLTREELHHEPHAAHEPHPSHDAHLAHAPHPSHDPHSLHSALSTHAHPPAGSSEAAKQKIKPILEDHHKSGRGRSEHAHGHVHFGSKNGEADLEGAASDGSKRTKTVMTVLIDAVSDWWNRRPHPPRSDTDEDDFWTKKVL